MKKCAIYSFVFKLQTESHSEVSRQLAFFADISILQKTFYTWQNFLIFFPASLAKEGRIFSVQDGTRFHIFNKKCRRKSVSVFIDSAKSKYILTYFMPLVSFYTSKNNGKPGVLMFSGGIERNNQHEMAWNLMSPLHGESWGKIFTPNAPS